MSTARPSPLLGQGCAAHSTPRNTSRPSNEAKRGRPTGHESEVFARLLSSTACGDSQLTAGESLRRHPSSILPASGGVRRYLSEKSRFVREKTADDEHCRCRSGRTG
jgi:hypothetical protein